MVVADVVVVVMVVADAVVPIDDYPKVYELNCAGVIAVIAAATTAAAATRGG